MLPQLDKQLTVHSEKFDGCIYKLYTFSSMKLFICLMSPNCKYSYKLVNIYIHVHSIFLQMSPKERQDSKKEVLFKQKPVIIGL